MKIIIGDFDDTSRTVPVTFEHDGVTHARGVNACLDGDGGYDADATAARVADVARGVEAKIAAGVLTDAPAPAPIDASAE